MILLETPFFVNEQINKTLVIRGVGKEKNFSGAHYEKFNVSQTNKQTLDSGSYTSRLQKINRVGLVVSKAQARLPRGLVRFSEAKDQFVAMMAAHSLELPVGLPLLFFSFDEENLPGAEKLGGIVTGIPDLPFRSLAAAISSKLFIYRSFTKEDLFGFYQRLYAENAKKQIEDLIFLQGQTLRLFHDKGFLPLTFDIHDLSPLGPDQPLFYLNPDRMIDLRGLNEAQYFGYVLLGIKSATRTYPGFSNPASPYFSLKIDPMGAFLRGYLSLPEGDPKIELLNKSDPSRLVELGHLTPVFKIDDPLIQVLRESFPHYEFKNIPLPVSVQPLPPDFVVLNPDAHQFKPLSGGPPAPLGFIFIWQWLGVTKWIHGISKTEERYAPVLVFLTLFALGFLDEVIFRRVFQFLILPLLHVDWETHYRLFNLVYAGIFATILHPWIFEGRDETPLPFFKITNDRYQSFSPRYVPGFGGALSTNRTTIHPIWLQIKDRIILFLLAYGLGLVFAKGWTLGTLGVLHGIYDMLAWKFSDKTGWKWPQAMILRKPDQTKNLAAQEINKVLKNEPIKICLAQADRVSTQNWRPLTEKIHEHSNQDGVLKFIFAGQGQEGQLGSLIDESLSKNKKEQTVLLIAETKEIAEKAQQIKAKLGLSFIVVNADGKKVFFETARRRNYYLDWLSLEDVLQKEVIAKNILDKKSFMTPSFQIVAQKDLTILLRGVPQLLDRQSLERAIIYWVNENLETIQSTVGKLDNLDGSTRVVHEQT
jgi:hypothetical protein